MKLNLRSICFLGIAALMGGSAMAQVDPDFSQVVQETKGDTLVIKSTTTSGFLNTVPIAVLGDTAADGSRNPNRVYETIPNEVYTTNLSVVSDASVQDLRIFAKKPAAGQTPPVWTRTYLSTGKYDKTWFETVYNLEVTNQYFMGHVEEGTQFESEFNRTSDSTARIIIDGCVFDLTRWVILRVLNATNSFFVTNCTFINLGSEATLEKGIALETRTVPPDTVWFENNTFINAGSIVMSLEHSAPTFAYFNHNTIVNVLHGPFLFHSSAEAIVENNLIINCALLPDYPGFYALFDDDDHLPKGIINVDTVDVEWKNNYWKENYPLDEADRKFLFDRNNIWWDSRFDGMNLTPISDTILPGATWASQRIVMNDRSQAIFDDDAAYPYFVEGDNSNDAVDFTELADRVPDWIAFVETNCIAGKAGKGNIFPYWRTQYDTLWYEIDWPLLANMAYSNATLKSAGLNKLPLGDLNWFPAEKATWESYPKESTVLIDAMKAGEVPVDIEAVETNKLDLNQLSVYPNPLASNSTVNYSLVTNASVKMNVYNTLGELVFSEDLGYQVAGTHVATLNKGNLNSGMYILQLSTNDNSSGVSTRIAIQ